MRCRKSTSGMAESLMRFTSDKNRCNHDPGCGNYRPIITGHKIEHEDNTTRTYETERW